MGLIIPKSYFSNHTANTCLFNIFQSVQIGCESKGTAGKHQRYLGQKSPFAAIRGHSRPFAAIRGHSRHFELIGGGKNNFQKTGTPPLTLPSIQKTQGSSNTQCKTQRESCFSVTHESHDSSLNGIKGLVDIDK